MELIHIYILFGAATATILAGFIGYRLGLQTVNDVADAALAKVSATAQTLSADLNSRSQQLIDANRALDAREREIRALRTNIQAEADDHANVERGLLQRLAAAAPLTDEDEATLRAIAGKLELAAITFETLGSSDHARFARQLAQHALNMAQRLQAARNNEQLPHQARGIAHIQPAAA